MTGVNHAQPSTLNAGAPARPQLAHLGTAVQPQSVMMGTPVRPSCLHVGTPVRPRRTQRRALARRHLVLVGAPSKSQWVQMGTPVQPLHSRAGTPAQPHYPPRCEARRLRHSCPTDSTSSAERAIARSVHRLCRSVTIHDCNVRPITWGHQEMCKHFTDVELVSTSH